MIATAIKLQLFFLCLLLLSCTFGERSGFAPGDSPPNFSLPDTAGKMHSLDEFRGKVVLINFWASWCVPCISEMPAMERLYGKLKSKGFTVLAIGIDDDEANLKEFTEKYGLSFPVLIDVSGKTKSLFRVRGVPESFFVGKDGKFIMMPDLDDNQPVVKIVGPRDWDSPNGVSRIERLVNAS